VVCDQFCRCVEDFQMAVSVVWFFCLKV
jgi:hypothetical protein